MSERSENRAWGTNAQGEPYFEGEQGKAGADMGASLAGTPAGDGAKNAEAQTSGLQPPEGTAAQGPDTGATRVSEGSGVYVDVDAAPPVHDL